MTHAREAQRSQGRLYCILVLFAAVHEEEAPTARSSDLAAGSARTASKVITVIDVGRTYPGRHPAFVHP